MNLNIASAIHDIKNMLVVIADCPDQPDEAQIKTIRRQAMVAATRLTTLLEIVDIETNHVEIHKVVVDTSQFMQDLYYDTMAYADKSYAMVCQDNEVLMVDTVVVTDAIVNAVQNANRYANSAITLKGRKENGSFIIEVIDDGPGFDEKRKPDNAGLGIKIAKQMLTHHGADLALLNDNGAVFRLTFPL